MTKASAPRKIFRAFTLQLVLISGATILGVLVTYWIVEDLLSQEALRTEADHFWSAYAENPQVPLPNTANLLGFLGPANGSAADQGSVPAGLVELQPGFGRVHFQQSEPLVHVSDRYGMRLYLVFAQERVSALTFYFGLVPLMLVLLVIYVLAYLTYRSTHQALSPFVALANHLEDFDFRRGTRIDLEEFRQQGNAEVDSLVDAITHFASGWEAALDRERVFTRDAGHELRTPVAVFKGSLDLLEQRQDRPKHDAEALSRMRRTVNDMESLLNTLLLLARAPAPASEGEQVSSSLLTVVHHQLDQYIPSAQSKGIQLGWAQPPATDVVVQAPAQVLDILVSNLLRNAINYTPAGKIELQLQDHSLIVKDTGVGIAPQEVNEVFNAFFRGTGGRDAAPGHGLGLALVKRIVDRYGWQITVHSELDVGTEFNIDFSVAAAPETSENLP